MAAIELVLLTQDENEKSLCRDYWALISQSKFSYSVAKLSQLYKTSKARINEIVMRGSRAYLASDFCKTAHCSSLRPIQSRAEYERNRHQRYFRREWVCDDCENAERARLEEELTRRATLLQSQFNSQIDKAHLVGRLSFRDTIFLVSVLRAGGSEELDYVRPLQSFQTPLSPSESYDEEILSRLFNAGLLCIHPHTPVGSTVVSEAQWEYPLRESLWALPLPSGGPSPARFLEVLEASLHEPWTSDWWSEAQALYREAALQECVRFLQLRLEDHYFKPICGEKTLLVLRSVLSHFSIGQAFNFIWRAVNQAAADVQKRLPKPHALNRIPGAIQRSAERALADGWIVKPFRRDYRAPESQIAQVLFTSVLKLPDSGLSVPPLWEADADPAESLQ